MLGSLAVAALLSFFGMDWNGSAGRAGAVLYALPVALTTLLIQGPLLKSSLRGPLGLSFAVNRWWLIAWLLPVFILVVALLFGELALGMDTIWTTDEFVSYKRALVPEGRRTEFERYVREHPPAHPFWLIVMALPAGATFNLIIALFEEIGFRGFLFRETPGGFWLRSVRIGILWGVWSAPLAMLRAPTAALGSALMCVAWCLLASPLLVYIRARSGSTIAVAASRGTLFALSGLASDLSSGAPFWVRPFDGLTGLWGIVVLLGVLYMYDRCSPQPPLMTSVAARSPSR